MVHNLLMQLFALGSSKIEVPKTYFLFDIVTTHNDHPSCVKYVLGSIYVFFVTPFRYWVWGGGGSLPGVLCEVDLSKAIKFGCGK